jgi:hypothetical protein
MVKVININGVLFKAIHVSFVLLVKPGLSCKRHGYQRTLIVERFDQSCFGDCQTKSELFIKVRHVGDSALCQPAFCKRRVAQHSPTREEHPRGRCAACSNCLESQGRCCVLFSLGREIVTGEKAVGRAAWH